MIDTLLIYEMSYRAEKSYFRFSELEWYKPTKEGLELVRDCEWLEELFQKEITYVL